jgi:uncharacterized protein YjgD (DUF1641 family)
MDSDVSLLHQKIDTLTALVTAQQERIQALEEATNGQGSLHAKLDYLVSKMEIQAQRQQEFDDLKNDVIPIANHLIKLSIDELAEVGTEFSLEDLLFLVKRLLRDTHLLVDLLDRIEGMVELSDELQVMTRQIFHQTSLELDRLERKGYFSFARSSWGILERIVQEFDEDDVNALGDNIVTILATVRNLTQPEIMSMTNNALQALQETPVSEKNVSIFSLVRDISDPKVRQGLARLLNLVRVLADQPNISKN